MSRYWQPAALSFILFVPIILIGLHDVFQKKHAILRNFPVVGHFRYILEMIRPEIQQYFIETSNSGKPFSKEERSIVYQRAKNVTDTLPFGTQKEIYVEGYEWISHSMNPTEIPHTPPRVLIGNELTSKPYSASLLNISAMSFGSLSKNAVLALNKGALKGGFSHNTGEGSISPHHLEHGGDLVWQVGTGYFGCRDKNGNFDKVSFAERATLENVKMIEIKISQGAKPGHGGILPGEKVTEEIADIRLVEAGKDVISPSAHTAFKTPIELMHFIQNLRELSGGKPVGFKVCIGKKSDFFAVCKAMMETKIYPDFITVDGGEGGTGAAPLEFTNRIGAPLNDGLVFAHNTLVGCGLRDKMKIIASARVITGFALIKRMALGADLCNSARGMMFALGCIQALRCNSNHCPAGIATQDPGLMFGLDIDDKAERIYNFHKLTLESFLHVLSAAGFEGPEHIRPWHINRRVSDVKVLNFYDIYNFLEVGQLNEGIIPESWERAWTSSKASEFKVG